VSKRLVGAAAASAAKKVKATVPSSTVVVVEKPTLGLLLPYQQRWVADRARVKIAEKGRRTGFTFGEAADNVVTAAASREAKGRNVYYIGTTLEMAREYIGACGRWALGLQYAASAIGEMVFDDIDDQGNSKSIKAFRLDFPSGFYITALSSRPRSLRGMQGDVVIDEAAFQDDLPGLLKAAMALLIWGGNVRIISTHNGVENVYNELLQDCLAGRKKVSTHRCTFDDACREGLGQRICEVTGETWTPQWQADFEKEIRDFYSPNDAEELDCIPAQSGGVYLPLALQLPCESDEVKVVRLSFKDEFLSLPLATRDAEVMAMCEAEIGPILAALDEDDPSYFGGDFGRSANRTTLWCAQLQRDNFLKSAFVLELYNCPFAQHRTIFKWIVDRLPKFTAGKLDARGNGAELAEFMRTEYGGERVEEVKATLDWYRVNWPFAKARLEDKAVDIPKDRDLQEDLRQVKVVKGVPVIPEANQGSDKGKKKRHGDAAIAFLNLTAAARAEPFAVGYETPSTSPRDRFEPRPAAGAGMRWEDGDEFSAARQHVTT
jgi:phage FluMu gp28-like protein